MSESGLEEHESEGAALCPFCEPDAARVAFRTPEIIAIRDAFPVTEGHLLIVPRRHVDRWDDLSVGEREALYAGVERGRALLKGQFDPDAFNVGYNDGAAAGQTIPHFHIHIIPRRRGDVSDPRGGVRHVIPAKGNYLAPSQPAPNLDLLTRAPHRQSLIAGGEDPLLPHLVRHIDDASAVDVAVAVHHGKRGASADPASSGSALPGWPTSIHHRRLPRRDRSIGSAPHAGRGGPR